MTFPKELESDVTIQEVKMEHAKELTRLLVSMESSNPGTYENTLADYLEAQLMAVLPGFGTIIRKEYVDKNATIENEKRSRPLIMAVLPGENTKKELVFICHIDTVPIGDGWSVNPLTGVDGYHDDGMLEHKSSIQDRIYGRGSCDMKSGLACALVTFAKACEQARKNGKFQNTLKLILTSDEEGDMQGVEYAIRWGWVQSTSMVMDTEPTNKEIQTAHKGRFWYELICHGKAAHASKPEEGANAILGMGYAMAEANALVQSLKEDDFCKKSCLTFGNISGGTQKYQVPAKCTVSVDMRLVPQYDVRLGERILREAGERASQMVEGVRFEVCIKGDRPAVAHHPDSKLLKLLQEVVEDVTGKSPKIAVFPGYTDTAVIAASLGCEETLSYGPGNLAQAHQPDEFVEVSDIERCEKVYWELVWRFLRDC